jgi:hypothetical protein
MQASHRLLTQVLRGSGAGPAAWQRMRREPERVPARGTSRRWHRNAGAKAGSAPRVARHAAGIAGCSDAPVPNSGLHGLGGRTCIVEVTANARNHCHPDGNPRQFGAVHVAFRKISNGARCATNGGVVGHGADDV